MTVEHKVLIELSAKGNLASALAVAKKDALALNQAVTRATAGPGANAARTAVAGAVAGAVVAGVAASIARASRAPGMKVQNAMNATGAFKGGAATLALPRVGQASAANVITQQRAAIKAATDENIKTLRQFEPVVNRHAIAKQNIAVANLKTQVADARAGRLQAPDPAKIQALQTEAAKLATERTALVSASKGFGARKRGKDATQIAAIEAEAAANAEAKRVNEEAAKRNAAELAALQQQQNPAAQLASLEASLKAAKVELKKRRNPKPTASMGGLYSDFYKQRQSEAKLVAAEARQESETLRASIKLPLLKRSPVNESIIAEIRASHWKATAEAERSVLFNRRLTRNMNSGASRNQYAYQGKLQYRAEAAENITGITREKIDRTMIGGMEQRSATASGVRLEDEKSLNTLRKKAVALQEIERYEGGTQGLQNAKRRQLIEKEIARSQKSLDNSRMVAQYGKFGATLVNTKNRAKELYAEFGPIEAAATRAFASGSAALLGFTALANPFAFDRFRRSIADLGAVFGQMLLPGLNAVTGYVRQFADYLVSLDPATKATIANFVLWGTALAGVVVVGGRVIAMAVMLGGAVGRLTMGMVALSRGMGAAFSMGMVGRMGTMLGLLGRMLPIIGIALGADWLVGQVTGRSVSERIFGGGEEEKKPPPEAPEGFKWSGPPAELKQAEFAERLVQMTAAYEKMKDQVFRTADPVSEAQFIEMYNRGEFKMMERLSNIEPKKRVDSVYGIVREHFAARTLEGEIAPDKFQEPIGSKTMDINRGGTIAGYQKALEKIGAIAPLMLKGLSHEEQVSRYWQGQGVSEGASGGGNPQYMELRQARDYLQQQALRAPIVIPNVVSKEEERQGKILERIEENTRPEKVNPPIRPDGPKRGDNEMVEPALRPKRGGS